MNGCFAPVPVPGWLRVCVCAPLHPQGKAHVKKLFAKFGDITKADFGPRIGNGTEASHVYKPTPATAPPPP